MDGDNLWNPKGHNRADTNWYNYKKLKQRWGLKLCWINISWTETQPSGPIITEVVQTQDYTNLVDFYRTRVRSLATLVSDSLNDCCLVDLIDVTLACKDANSKLVDFVTVAELMLRNMLSTVWCRFESWMFGQDSEVEVHASFWSWSLISIAAESPKIFDYKVLQLYLNT